MKIKDMISDGSYDIGYILPPSFGAAAGFKLAGIPTRIGYIADGRRLLLTKPLPLPEPLNSEHRAEVYFNLLRRGSGLDLTFVRPKLFVTEAETARALEILAGHGITEDEDYVALAVQAVAESRRWGLENYADLANYITAELHTKVVIIGAESDRQAGDTVAELSFEDVINLAGKTTLRESAAILSQALLFAGNDSGPAHLAAAVGCPLVVFSGADDPKETSPMSSRKRLLYLDHLDCISCVKNKCHLSGEAHMACMKGISIEMAIDAVNSLIAEVRSAV
jgi:lipopolysaccharide heptosyltransferase II